jgi:prepilin-type N-terminal cleavage/methylation domain-containing protein
MPSIRNSHSRTGFSLVEIVIVISVLAILAGAMVPRFSSRLAAARDARRISDINAIRDAIDQYYQDKGVFPAPTPNATAGGWDVSDDGDFIPDLVEQGYLSDMPKDPLNDAVHQYRYFVYAKGQYGCVGTTPYYVLGIRNFETAEFAARNKGYFKCSGRDWSNEFAYVTGGGASYR